MTLSILLMVGFLTGIVKRLIADAYYRTLGILVLLLALVGTLYKWLAEGWPVRDAVGYAATTMSMNTPYLDRAAWAGAGWPTIAFHAVYSLLSVGVFLVFVLETAKTMVKAYEETMQKRAARRAKEK